MTVQYKRGGGGGGEAGALAVSTLVSAQICPRIIDILQILLWPGR